MGEKIRILWTGLTASLAKATPFYSTAPNMYCIIPPRGERVWDIRHTLLVPMECWWSQLLHNTIMNNINNKKVFYAHKNIVRIKKLTALGVPLFLPGDKKEIIH